MGIRCLFQHDWDGCICLKCRKSRDIEHNWENDCEKCSKCGMKRDDEHIWMRTDCEKCYKCGMTRKDWHNSNGCQCSKCGKILGDGHNWVNGSDVCSRCGTSKYTLEMVFVEGGTFQMGNQSDTENSHSVILGNYFMGRSEVTQELWNLIQGLHPVYYKGHIYPVVNVNWYDCINFCNKLSVKEGLSPCYTGEGDGIKCDFSLDGYRLPTEAEWEFAAKGGNHSKGFKYSGSDNLMEVAWFRENSSDFHNPIGQTYRIMLKKGNELDIYDMSGNVCEWCWDWYGNYSIETQHNPHGLPSGKERVRRGGDYISYPYECEVNSRGNRNPNDELPNLGFRLCRTALK